MKRQSSTDYTKSFRKVRKKVSPHTNLSNSLFTLRRRDTFIKEQLDRLVEYMQSNFPENSVEWIILQDNNNLYTGFILEFPIDWFTNDYHRYKLNKNRFMKIIQADLPEMMLLSYNNNSDISRNFILHFEQFSEDDCKYFLWDL